jgi:hypothetical protein
MNSMTIFTDHSEFCSLSATTDSGTLVASAWHPGINLSHNSKIVRGSVGLYEVTSCSQISAEQNEQGFLVMDRVCAIGDGGKDQIKNGHGTPAWRSAVDIDSHIQLLMKCKRVYYEDGMLNSGVTELE